MSVYRLAAPNTSCDWPGCACRDRARRYPSDLTDEQWVVLELEVRAAMAELTGRRDGRWFITCAP